MTTSALSPALSESRVQPWRISTLGLNPSSSHSTLPPLVSETTSLTQQWGLVHRKRLTVPSSDRSRWVSNIENEWCAAAACVTSSAEPARVAQIPAFMFRYAPLPAYKTSRHCGNPPAAWEYNAPARCCAREVRIMFDSIPFLFYVL